MNKENRGAASLRRSAVVERIRLREEWSALKGTTNDKGKPLRQNNTKSRRNLINALAPQKSTLASKKVDRFDKQISDVLRGIVVLVEVGSESRALALRAALSALGASVVPYWSPLVTHLVWTQGGCRSVRAKARALACQLVSPLWVEACAAEGRKLPERIFPAPSRPSDLPSPATLRRLLKKAEHENIPLQQLLPDSQGSDGVRPARLRLSSETDQNTTNSTDTSRDMSKETSQDSPDIQTRVNTAPRRPPQNPINPQKPTKSKRKLFTQKEPELQTTDDENDAITPAAEPKKAQQIRITLRKDLAQAERLAKRLMGTTPAKKLQAKKTLLGTQLNKPPRIVLTGMSRTERQDAWRAIRELNGKVQNHVDKKTTHVIMGSCREMAPTTPAVTRESPKVNHNKSPNPKEGNLSICSQCNSPGKILTLMFANNVTVEANIKNRTDKVICKCKNNDISGVNYLLNDTQTNNERDNAQAQSTATKSVNVPQSNDGNDKICSARRKTRSSHALSLSRRNILSNEDIKNTRNDNVACRMVKSQSNMDNRENAQAQSNDDTKSVNPQSNDGNDKICSARRKTRSSHALSLSRRNILSYEDIKNTRNDNVACGMVKSQNISSPFKKKTQSSDIFSSENVQSKFDNDRDTQSNLLCSVNGNKENICSLRDNRIGNDVLHASIENIQSNDISPVTDNVVETLQSVVKKFKPRTVNALLGAARGCRVLRFEWVKDSLEVNRWLQHIGYEVPHLKKMSQKARAERSALNKMHSDYAYNVFNGMRVKISPDAEQKDAITQLLTLCGAVIQNNEPIDIRNVQNAQNKPHNGIKITFSSLLTRVDKIQNGGLNGSKLINDVREKKHGRRIAAQTQDGGKIQYGGKSQDDGKIQYGGKSQDGGKIQDGGALTADVDLTIGRANGEVSSKWVFDSVAAARMRTTRRYINNL